MLALVIIFYLKLPSQFSNHLAVYNAARDAIGWDYGLQIAKM